MHDTSPDEKLSLAEAAPLLGVLVHTLRAWTRQRRIAYFRLGRRLIFSRRDLETFLASNRVAPRDEG